MSATELFRQARSVGLKLTARGKQLEVIGPKEALRSTLIEELRRHKTEILVHLKGDLYQEWLFEIVKVGDDPWMIGTRLDKPNCWMFWFVKDEVSKQ